MGLSYGQRRRYVDTFRVYRYRKLTGDPTTGQVGDDVWDLIATDVRGGFQSTPNNTSPMGPAGQIQPEQLLTEDRCQFAYDVDLRAKDVIRCMTPGKKRFGKLWALMGDPQELDTRANCQEARLRLSEHLNSLMPDKAEFGG